MNRRPLGLLFVTLAALTTAITACDTGDGKQLKPYDPADYPATTLEPPSIGGSVPIESDLGSDAALGNLDGAGQPPSFVPAEAFTITAPWAPGAPIDARYTCDGDGVAPAVSWGGVPSGTVEVAISMVDDSVVSDGRSFVHWAIAGLDPDEIALAAGDVPVGAIQALNYFGDVGYGGPCPPPGDAPHDYRLTAYALNQQLEVADGTPATEFLDAISAITITSTDVTGTFGR